MSETQLTKDTYRILCELYKIYLQRRKDGMSKSEAVYFCETQNIQNTYMPEITSDDYYDSVVELKNSGYVKMYVDGGFVLDNQAIILMENRFKNGLSDVMDFISKIPFI